MSGVYRIPAHPRPGPKIAAVAQQGVVISADSRLSVYSPLNGSSSVSKPTDSRLAVRSLQSGNTSVSKPVESRFEFRSLARGDSLVFRFISADARAFFYSLLRGNSTVSTGLHADPTFEASRLTMAVNIVDRRSVDVRWLNQILLDWQSVESFRIVDLEMTKTGVKIDSVVIGDDFRVSRVYTGLPTGITLTTAWFTVKTSESVGDGSALLQKVITPVESPSGHIVTASTSNGFLEMFFDPTKTETGVALVQDYVYDIQVKTDQSKIYTLEKGIISFITGVTSAT